MVFLGIRNETAGSVWGLHSPRFQLDESQLPLGAALHAGFALEALRWAAGAERGAAAAGAAAEVRAEL